MSKTFYIIDGHSQIFRAYYAPFGDLASPAGEPTRATFVFTQMLLNLIESRRPDYLVMAMDSRVETLQRRGLSSQYKATRKPIPEDFPVQERRIAQIVRAMNIPIWQGGGVEADDYLASAAAQLAGPATQVVLVSRDKDLDQALGRHVVMFDPMKNEVIDEAALVAQKGYGPQQAVEVQTLCGDATDNIPGVPGVGPKTAAKLIQTYGSAQAVLERADELSPKLRQNVKAFAEQLPVTRELVTLRRDVELPTALEDCRWRGYDPRALLAIFEELGFSRLIGRMRGEIELISRASRPAWAGPGAAGGQGGAG